MSGRLRGCWARWSRCSTGGRPMTSSYRIRLHHLHFRPLKEDRLKGQLQLLGALIKALDRRSLGAAGRGGLVGTLIRGACFVCGGLRASSANEHVHPAVRMQS